MVDAKYLKFEESEKQEVQIDWRAKPEHTSKSHPNTPPTQQHSPQATYSLEADEFSEFFPFHLVLQGIIQTRSS